MKNFLLASSLLLVLSGNSFAGDNHKHTNEKGKHDHKHEKCEKCKNGRKECKCDDEHGGQTNESPKQN